MNKSITYNDIRNNRDLTKDCRTFYANIHSLKEFGNYCNCNVFVYLFGNDEGSRLWMCFVEDAHRNIYKLFFEYLNNEQKFVLSANVLDNKDLKMASLFSKFE